MYLLQIKSISNNSVNIEPVTLVVVLSTYMVFIGPITSIAWRFYVDGLLSTVLSKMEDFYTEIVKLSVVTAVQKRSIWFITMGFSIDYMLNIILLIRHMVKNKSTLSLTKQVCMNHTRSIV